MVNHDALRLRLMPQQAISEAERVQKGLFKITIMKKTIKPFNVINFEINSSKFEAYNVMPYLVNCYKKEKKDKRPITFDEFKVFTLLPSESFSYNSPSNIY